MFGCDVVEVVVGEYPKSLAAFVVTEINKKEEKIYKYELKKRENSHTLMRIKRYSKFVKKDRLTNSSLVLVNPRIFSLLLEYNNKKSEGSRVPD